MKSPRLDRAGWMLVGGKSSRMGADKALLLHPSGVPMALYAARRIAEVCGAVSLVGDPALYSPLGLPVTGDTFPGLGPLAGIDAALGSTTAERNLIVACDMPALDLSTLERLFEAGGDCALPRYSDGRVEPLCAVYHRRCGPLVRAALSAGMRKVTDALQSLAIQYVAVESAASFVNLNTPEDLERYLHG